jgi:hypothetical protein
MAGSVRDTVKAMRRAFAEYNTLTVDRRLMIQQFVGVVRRRSYVYMVFETGEPGWYLFCTATNGLIFTGLNVPVRKSGLRRVVQSGLRQRGFYDATGSEY